MPPKGADEGNAKGLGTLASERIKPSLFQGEGGPQGRMRVGIVGCIYPRRADGDIRPYAGLR